MRTNFIISIKSFFSIGARIILNPSAFADLIKMVKFSEEAEGLLFDRKRLKDVIRIKVVKSIIGSPEKFPHPGKVTRIEVVKLEGFVSSRFSRLPKPATATFVFEINGKPRSFEIDLFRG